MIATQATADRVLTTLSPVPDDLPGWQWEERVIDDTLYARLAYPTEGWATHWQMPAYAEFILVGARAIVAREAAAVAEVRAEEGATAMAPFTPGPDADGIYRRPPGMAERIMVAPRELEDGRWQPRETYDDAALAELTASINEHGVLEDLIALVNEHGELELITGHRRKRAAQAAGGRDVPVKVVEVSEAQASEIAIISNDQRTDLTEVERGRAYERLIAEQGISEAELARRLSRPRAYIQQRRMLAGAAPAVQAAIVAGEISFTQARGVCEGSGGDHAVQAQVVSEIAKERRADRVVSGEAAKDLGIRRVHESTAADLTRLGWQHAEWWSSVSGTGMYHWYYAAGQTPVACSSAELIAIVREGTRPSTKMTPTPLADDDRAALVRYGWQFSERCKPWLLACRGKHMTVGDAGDFADHVTLARADLAAILTRFTACGWDAQWRGGATLRATPPAQPDAKKKPQFVEAYSYTEAEKLIRQIEQGKWTPAPAATKGSSGSAIVCARCKKKVDTGWRWIEGAYHCEECKNIVLVQHAALKQRLAGEVDRQLGAWIDAAPQVASALLVLLSPQHAAAVAEIDRRGAALRDIFTGMFFEQRAKFDLTTLPAEEGATAMAGREEAV